MHHERPGGTFENVDLVAVHWRSSKIAEVVSVKVKLDFTSRLVQQANNYRRFSDRVWIVVPVQAELGQAAAELRAMDERLFDHVVDLGLGVLACRRRQGRSYEVVPIHWPVRNVPEPLEARDVRRVAPRAAGGGGGGGAAGERGVPAVGVASLSGGRGRKIVSTLLRRTLPRG